MRLSPQQQQEILNLYRGQPIIKAERALDIMEAYVAKREHDRLSLKLKMCRLTLTS